MGAAAEAFQGEPGVRLPTSTAKPLSTSIALLLLLLLAPAGRAAPPIVVRDAPPASDNPMLMNTAAHLKAVCGDLEDTASQLVCVSWMNGAAQVNARFTTLNPALLPDFCPPDSGLDLGQQRDVVLAWLDANPGERETLSIMAYRMALAAAYPCKPD